MTMSDRAAALLLVLALVATAARVDASLPGAGILSAETAVASSHRCRAELGAAVVRYADRVLDARRRCRNETVRGKPRVGTDCRDGLQPGRELRRLEAQLGRAGRACDGVRLETLGLPGVCDDATGAPFEVEDFRECVVERVDEALGTLLDVYFPPLAKQPRGTKLACATGAPRVGSTSFSQETSARSACLLEHDPSDGTDCRALIPPRGDGTGDEATDGAVARAEETLLRGLPEVCSRARLEAIGFPGACKGRTGGEFTTADLERCLLDANHEAALAVLAIVFPPATRCGNGIVDPGEDCDDGTDNSDAAPDACRSNCRNASCGDGTVDSGETCDDGNRTDGDGCAADCGRNECGDGIRSPAEECDGDASVCGPGEACSINCSCEPACPGVAEVAVVAGYGALCSTNGDCPVGECGDSGRCETATRLDGGWTGLAHHADPGDGARLRGFLECDGRGPVCGECRFVGLDPSTGNCRCSNDTRTICDEPFEADDDDCGGSVCDCYAGPPVPVVAGGTPMCLLSRFSADVSGTVDVDLGASELALRLKTQLFLGVSTRSPCPVCGGTCSNAPSTFCTRDEDCAGGTCALDPVAGDGLRGGICSGDSTAAGHGLPCDVSGTNSHFPAQLYATGGAGYSLDCRPAVGKNVTGSGLAIDLTQTTGSDSLSSQLSCTGPFAHLSCPCLTCSSDPTIACNSDDECAALGGSCVRSSRTKCQSDLDCAAVDVGPCTTSIGRCSKATSVLCTTDVDCESADVGTCTPPTCSARGSSGQGAVPLPNGCVDLLCTDLGGGNGECTTGPDTKYCAGVVRADGRGILSCTDDSSCYPWVVGVDARPCALVERAPCFLAPITATGVADPHAPVVVSTFCVPPTSGAGINDVIGLPGPGRLRQQMVMTTFCANDPEKAYEPGVGGCIDSWPTLPKTTIEPTAAEGKGPVRRPGR